MRVPFIGLLVVVLAVVTAVMPPAREIAMAEVPIMRVDPPSLSVPAGAPYFTVDIFVEDAEGVGAFEFMLLFDDLDLRFVSVDVGPFLGSSGREVYCWPIVGDLSIQFGCNTEGEDPGASGSDVVAMLGFAVQPGAVGTTDLLMLDCGLATVLGDAIPVTCEGGSVDVVPGEIPTPTPTVPPMDSDGDGCTDVEELGDDPNLGGTRDPYNFWDFYDVPVPTAFNGGTLVDRDKAITIANDLLAVLEYAGTSDGGLCNSGPDHIPSTADDRCYDQDNNGDGQDDGILYDRSVGVTWSDAPDGAITIFVDMMLVLAQGGHSCQAPP